MSQASGAGSARGVVGDILIVAAVVIAVFNNNTVKWAVGVPLVLAIAGVGLWIEAAISRSR